MNACVYELDALANNGTWEFVDLPRGRKAIKSNWVFQLEADSHYHARLVAGDTHKIPNIVLDETFLPIACLESLRLLLALAALEDWEIHSLDVQLAVLMAHA